MTVLERDSDGRPAKWTIETEPEFDANERDSWAALEEWRDAICPRCGNLRAICSQPGGATGQGFHVAQSVCYASAVLEATQRRIERKFKDEQPDLNGMLTRDGVSLGIALEDPETEDILGLDERTELERRLSDLSRGD